MSAFGNITIQNGVAADKTFATEDIAQGVVSWVDRSAGFSLGFVRLLSSLTFGKKAGTVNRARFDVEYPVVATVNSVPTVVRTLRAQVTYILPDGCSDAERKDLHAFVLNGLANNQIAGQMRDYDKIN